METFQRMHQDLPEEIRSRIYKFMSHPLADVMRPLVEHWREWDQFCRVSLKSTCQ